MVLIVKMPPGIKCSSIASYIAQMTGKVYFFKKKKYIYIPCMYVFERVPDPQELELHTIVSCHVGSGN